MLFNTLYFYFPYSKSRLVNIKHRCFSKTDGTPRYIVLGRDFSYFVKKNSKSSSKYTEEDVFKTLEFFFIDNLFVLYDGRVFQQTVGIPTGTNCTPLLADQFLYSYEAAEFIADLI